MAAAELVEILMIYHYHLYYVSVSDVPTVIYQQVYIMLRNRAGTGMTKQVWVEYKVSNKFQLQVALGSFPHEFLPENTWITGDVIHRHKGFKYASTMTSNFIWPKNFSAVSSQDELQINQ